MKKNNSRKRKTSRVNDRMGKATVFFVSFALLVTLIVVLVSSVRYPDEPSSSVLFSSESSPTLSPVPTSTPTSEPDLSAKAVIMAAGDIIIHDSLLEGAKQTDASWDFSHLLEHLENIFSDSDYATANFEGTTTGPKYGGWPHFNAPDEVAKAIFDAGIDMVTTANNHSYDKGVDGVIRTAKVFSEAGLKIIGTRQSAQDPLYEIVDINGIKVGFAGYTYETTGTETTRSINGITMDKEAWPLIDSFNYYRKDRFENDKREMEERVEDMRSAGAQVVIFNIHWGEEYKTRSNSRQQELAEHLADCGVDVVFGHHPHVLQEIEILPSNSPSGNTLVYYSLSNVMGNMLYSTHQSYGNAEDAVIARIVIERSSTGEVTVTEGKYIKTYIWKDSSSGKVMHRALPVVDVLQSPEKYPVTESVLALLRDSSARIDKVLSSSHTLEPIEIDEFDG